MNTTRYFSRFVQRLQVFQHAPERLLLGKSQLTRRQQQRQQAHQELYRVSPLARRGTISSSKYHPKRRLAPSPFVQQAYENFLHSAVHRLSSISSTKRICARRTRSPLSSLQPSTMFHRRPKEPEGRAVLTQVRMRQTRRHRVMPIGSRQLLRKYQHQGQVKRDIKRPPSPLL